MRYCILGHGSSPVVIDSLAHTRGHGLWTVLANQSPQLIPADALRCVQSNTQTKLAGRMDLHSIRLIADFIASGGRMPNPHDAS